MTRKAASKPSKPVLQIVSFSADSSHIIGYIYFLDPEHAGEPRQYNVEGMNGAGSVRVFPAGSQAHWPGSAPYTAEARRIATAILAATFPSITRSLDLS